MSEATPQPTCCRDALFNWAIHFNIPGDIPADVVPLLDLCDSCRAQYANRG